MPEIWCMGGLAMDREEERGYYGIRRGFSHNLSLQRTRPGREFRSIIALPGR